MVYSKLLPCFCHSTPSSLSPPPKNSGIPSRVGEMLSDKVVKYPRSSLCLYRCRLHYLLIYSLVRVDHIHLYTPSFPHVIPSLPDAIIMWISRRVMDKAWPYVWYCCCKNKKLPASFLLFFITFTEGSYSKLEEKLGSCGQKSNFYTKCP